MVSHLKLDPARRSDPGVNFPWDKFKDLVLNGITSNNGDNARFLVLIAAAPEASSISLEINKEGCCEG